MRTLLLVCLVAATAAAEPKPLARLDMAEPKLVVVWAGADEVPDYKRHLFEGKVTKVKRSKDHINLVTMGRDRFQVGLPPSVNLPIRAGDRIRAEMWVDGGKLHARVTDQTGLPLVFMNELPDEWSMVIGDVAKGIPDRAPIYQHWVQFAAPNTPKTQFAGWLKGDVDGKTYAVYGEARVVNQAEAAKQGVKLDWSSSLFSAIVRVN